MRFAISTDYTGFSDHGHAIKMSYQANQTFASFYFPAMTKIYILSKRKPCISFIKNTERNMKE